LSKNRQMWLSDRYLTREYLNKLHYVNVEKIKSEITRDIGKISKIKSVEELKTSREITLKEAYDLYKDQEKFDSNIEKLKNYKDDDETALKLLITSFYFIFNLYRFRNKYEKEAFEAMQYLFWKTVIEVGDRVAGLVISADFLQHSLKENPEDLFITEGNVVDTIKEDEQFKEKIQSIIEKYGENKKEFIVKGEDADIHFNNNDLYFSIHSATGVIKGKYNKGKWKLNICFEDTYDYTKLKKFEEYIKDAGSVGRSLFSSTLYNLALFSMKLGVLKEYEIKIEFEYEVE